MNLRYDYFAATCNGVNKHAQDVMNKLGITYRSCIGRSMGDDYLFWDCENVPAVLPKYITEHTYNRADYGL